MKNIFKGNFSFSSPVILSLLLILLLAVLALGEYMHLGLARRTFVFYTVSDGAVFVENRMLKHSRSQEDDLIRYVEETLLGPVSPGLHPLIAGGTKLISLLFRDGVVYINLSENAAVAQLDGRSVRENFITFYSGILRNFSFVNDVRFYIEGNSIFDDEFRREMIQYNEGFFGV